MIHVNRLFLALLFSASLLAQPRAQDSAEQPDSDGTQASQSSDQDANTTPVNGGNEPRIHGRSSPSGSADDGKPLRFVAPPPRDISRLTPEQCESFPSNLAKNRAFQQEKTRWNLRKIAVVGGGYGISECKAAEKAWEEASDETFDKAASCRRAVDALYARECGGYPGDADCAAAERDTKLADYLGDQNTKFKRELAAREEEGIDLSLCGRGATPRARDGEVGSKKRDGIDASRENLKQSGTKRAGELPVKSDLGSRKRGWTASEGKPDGRTNDPATVGSRSTGGRASGGGNQGKGRSNAHAGGERRSRESAPTAAKTDGSKESRTATRPAPAGAGPQASAGAVSTASPVMPALPSIGGPIMPGGELLQRQPFSAAAGPGSSGAQQAAPPVSAECLRLQGQGKSAYQAILEHDKAIKEYNSLREKYIQGQNEYNSQCAGKPATQRCGALKAELEQLFPKVSPKREKELTAERDRRVKAFEKIAVEYTKKCVAADCRKLIGLGITPAKKTLKSGGKSQAFTAQPLHEKTNKPSCLVEFEWGITGGIGVLGPVLVTAVPPSPDGPRATASGSNQITMALRPNAQFAPGVKQVTGTVSVRGTDQATGLSLSAAAQVTIERPALTGLSIEAPSGPIVAGGAAVTFRAVPAPRDADAKIEWSVKPTSLGSFKPKITKPGETTAFKPGAKPGNGRVTAKDVVSGIQASVNLAVAKKRFINCVLVMSLPTNRKCVYRCDDNGHARDFTDDLSLHDNGRGQCKQIDDVER